MEISEKKSDGKENKEGNFFMEKIIILTPFSFNSVIFYHQLRKMEGYRNRDFLWFDSNPKLWGETYDDVFICDGYYSEKMEVIICTDVEKYELELQEKFRDLGFDIKNIYKYKDERFTEKISECEAATYVDALRYVELKPDKWLADDLGYGVARIKKMRKWSEIANMLPENENLLFEDFMGFHRKESCVDKEGKVHLILRRLEIDVTSKCSLRCKHCASMMQYFTFTEDVCTEVVLKDYNRMLDLIDWTDDILILGGEPFMNKELDKIVAGVLDNKKTELKVGTVKIVTNGTIVPNDRLLNVLSNSNVVVEISNYRENSKSIDDLVGKFLKYNIKYFVINIQHFVYTSQLEKNVEPMSKEELLSFRARCSNRCRVVSNGKFFLCAFLRSAHMLKAIPKTQDGYLDIYDENIKDKLAHYLSGTEPLPIACSWCSGDSKELWNNEKYYVPVAEQVNKPVEYMKYSW